MKFSIIMPTYNCERYVAEAVNSVLAQTYGDFELIIVDDGSHDDTFAVCEGLAKNKESVRLFSVPHGGVSTARNFGLTKASGDYVLFIDCDDSWEKDLLSSVAGLLDEKNELLLFGMGHDYYLSDDTFQYSETDLGNSGEVEDLPPDIAPDRLISSYNMASPCNKVYKREILEKNALAFCEKCVYLEDLKFNFDYLGHISKIKVLKNDLYHYRLFTDKKQIFKRSFKEWFVNADELFHSCVKYLSSRGIEIETQPTLIGMLTAAYGKEFTARAHGADRKTEQQAFFSLNRNENFKRLLTASRGRLFRVYRILDNFGFRGLQIRLLKRRFD